MEWARSNPRQAEEIGQNGKRFATRHLHKHAAACYWWQLLRAFAALQNFEPRTEGFKALSTRSPTAAASWTGRGRRKNTEQARVGVGRADGEGDGTRRAQEEDRTLRQQLQLQAHAAV